MSNISQHISKKFDVALDDIHNKVLGMGGLVEEQLKKALLSFINSEQKTAEIVIENEKKSLKLDQEEEFAAEKVR